jgi:hypothetical protein
MTEPKKEPTKCKVTLDQVMAAIEADDCLGFCPEAAAFPVVALPGWRAISGSPP